MRGIGGSLKVERKGDRVTLRAVYFSPVFAIIWTLTVAAIVFGTKRSGAMAFDSPIDVIAPAFMFAVGILALFHRTIATSFDMTTKTVLQQRTLLPFGTGASAAIPLPISPASGWTRRKTATAIRSFPSSSR